MSGVENVTARGNAMRQSRYNITVDYEGGEHLVFNTANGAFATLSDAGFAAYEAADAGAFPALAEAGFLTKLSAEEELAAQQRLFDNQRYRHDTLTICVVPTYVCNYRCPYCYEEGHNKISGFMDERVINALAAFIEGRYEANPFSRLEVQWYGGEPSLCLDVVKAATDKMRGFCETVGAAYDAMMLSNCYAVDDEAAQLIASCGISFMYMTVDGPAEHHDKRRIHASGKGTFDRTIAAARALHAYGVKTAGTMNVDKTIMPLFPEFSEQLLAEEGIELTPGQLNDYGHCYGTGTFCKPEFDLFNHEEFARARYELCDKGKRSAGELREMLSPQTHFCSGQKQDYYVVDLLGDVYKCDGWVGDKNFVKFNLFDDPSTWQLDIVSHDATRDDTCSQCALLPICHGSCVWERTLAIPETGKMPCHPLKTTIADYLADYRACFGDAASSDEAGSGAGADVRVLAQPMSSDTIAAK